MSGVSRMSRTARVLEPSRSWNATAVYQLSTIGEGVELSRSAGGRSPPPAAALAVQESSPSVDSVVAGAIMGIAALGLDLGTGWSFTLGGLAFAVSLGAFILWAERLIARYVAQLVVRFPTPGSEQGLGTGDGHCCTWPPSAPSQHRSRTSRTR